MPPAVDRGDPEGVGEAVEAERPRQADDVAAIDQPPAEPALPFRVPVEMHLGGVLVEPGRGGVLGLLDRHAVGMVDLLARFVVAPAPGLAGQGVVPARRVEAGGRRQPVRGDGLRQVGHGRFGRRRGRIPLAHHDPADIAEDRLAALVLAGRADPDDAGPAVGVLAQAEHLGAGRQAVAGPDRRAERAIGIAQVGDRVQRDVRHRLAEHRVEHQQVVERRARETDGLRKGVRRLHGEAAAGERGVERRVALGQRARRGVPDLLPDAEILEEVAGVRLGHGASRTLRRGRLVLRDGHFETALARLLNGLLRMKLNLLSHNNPSS